MKRKLVFATNNAHKLEEVAAILGDEIELLSLKDIGCHEDIPETADTLEGNASLKSSFIQEKYGYDCFADDTGLEVEALNGAPGVYSARYAGEGHDSEANMQKLLHELQDKENRNAQFRTAISLLLDGKEYQFEGIVKGEITREKRGASGFGYDPIFVPEGHERTFAELGNEVKNGISHRAIAVRKLCEFLRLSLFTLAALLMFSSCVSKKKFMIAEAGRMAAITRGDSLYQLLGESRRNGLQLTGQVNGLKVDTTRLGKSLRHYKNMLTANQSKQQQLSVELDDRERTIQELQQMIQAQNNKVQQLLNSVKDALLGFSSEELTVCEKNGKVYVAMSDKLLFQSGSAKVDQRGEEALSKLAEVLNKQTDIDVFIEGHTDNKPIHTTQFKDNWDLSVIRATSVVRILTQKYEVNPLQIQPSGRGEWMPIADNEMPEGRSKNRRTEIIMAPKLDKLFQMLQSSDN